MRYYNNNYAIRVFLEEIIMDYKIALIPGDGIGPEIVREAKKVLDKVCEKYGHSFSYSEVL